uniref:Large ribosomal subunit protein bL28m n=1 Tax=Tetraselmis sp. GSL018 TaxID=582737 RepID=A0A061QVY0_9CHLO|mmetsp:Transcript_13002/g.30842  ORF Transcript_13002/g.30842 Transcript_13002/m.30842 type:complete len:121 (-) Transcript_13002:95-457(-)
MLPLGIRQFARAFAKRTRRGLYHGKHPHFGDQISEDGKNRTRRKWNPNVQKKRLYSETLGRMIPFKVTTCALKAIDRAGGLDNYLLYTREDKLGSDVGLVWKQIIKEAQQAKSDGGEVAP